MATKNLLFKNNSYDKVRLSIFGEEDSGYYQYYCEANGNRYFFKPVGAPTASILMESATFDSFLSFTMSGAQTFTYSIIPMATGSSVLIDTKVVAVNSDLSKGYMMKSFGGYLHTGAGINNVDDLIYTTRTNFTTASASFAAIGTASIALIVSGQTDENIDWDVHISYTLGFHKVSDSPCYGDDCSENPDIYPPYNPPD